MTEPARPRMKDGIIRRGRSYGFVHKLLEEAGVTFRRRGGIRRTRLPKN